jgi:hypothetical protein
MGGIMGSSVVFALDVQADYSLTETDSIDRYKLWKQVVYNSRAAKRHLENAKAKSEFGTVTSYAIGAVSLARAAFSLSISVGSLGGGQHIECKDLDELLEAEEAVMEACRTLKRYLETAKTFNGSIALIDFEDGEKLHTERGSLEFISTPATSFGDLRGPADELTANPLMEWFSDPERGQARRIAAFAAVAVVLLLILVKCV